MASLHIHDIIFKKRNGQRLSAAEIGHIVEGYTRGEIPDYQASAFLMAAFLRGLDPEEIAALTRAMIDSGETVDLSMIPAAKIDKHSTGGVGDGTSLVIAPLVASCGVAVPMMSGRSLGHTGGTLDKLESIPGFRVNLTLDEYRDQLKKIGVAMIGQTENIAPADKKLYALRDVTATVDCIGLIAASIMSKKLAEGCDALLLDVKTGSGAFMKSTAGARQLARTMLGVAKDFGVPAQALITDMNQPLGEMVGNALEIQQAVEVMKGRGPSDFVDLVLELSARMLIMGGAERDILQAKKTLKKRLSDGSALAKFKQLVEAQGGDASVVDAPERVLALAARREDITATASGYITYIDTAAVGRIANYLGAGRITKEDNIDHAAGIVIHKKLGGRVQAGEPLATFHYGNACSFDDAPALFRAAYNIGAEKPAPVPVIYEEL